VKCPKDDTTSCDFEGFETSMTVIGYKLTSVDLRLSISFQKSGKRPLKDKVCITKKISIQLR